MTDNVFSMLTVAQGVMLACAKRTLEFRISQVITRRKLAERVGIAEGSIKRFEREREIQFRMRLGFALVLGRLNDFTDVFKISDVPDSLYHPEPKPPRQRARNK